LDGSETVKRAFPGLGYLERGICEGASNVRVVRACGVMDYFRVWTNRHAIKRNFWWAGKKIIRRKEPKEYVGSLQGLRKYREDYVRGASPKAGESVINTVN